MASGWTKPALTGGGCSADSGRRGSYGSFGSGLDAANRLCRRAELELEAAEDGPARDASRSKDDTDGRAIGRKRRHKSLDRLGYWKKQEESGREIGQAVGNAERGLGRALAAARGDGVVVGKRVRAGIDETIESSNLCARARVVAALVAL